MCPYAAKSGLLGSMPSSTRLWCEEKTWKLSVKLSVANFHAVSTSQICGGPMISRPPVRPKMMSMYQRTSPSHSSSGGACSFQVPNHRP